MIKTDYSKFHRQNIKPSQSTKAAQRFINLREQLYYPGCDQNRNHYDQATFGKNSHSWNEKPQ